jgi:hypothetical protein
MDESFGSVTLNIECMNAALVLLLLQVFPISYALLYMSLHLDTTLMHYHLVSKTHGYTIMPLQVFLVPYVLPSAARHGFLLPRLE